MHKEQEYKGLEIGKTLEAGTRVPRKLIAELVRRALKKAALRRPLLGSIVRSFENDK